jgi:hypothetical protein
MAHLSHLNMTRAEGVLWYRADYIQVDTKVYTVKGPRKFTDYQEHDHGMSLNARHAFARQLSSNTGQLWAPEQGTKPIFSHYPWTCGVSLIHGKWCKLWFTLFGITVDSFLDGSSLQLLDIHDCDHSDMYLGRDQTAFMHRYINCWL